MTRDDVIRMAREASGLPDPMIFVGAYERFAALVAAAEREACAKVCDYQITRWTDDRARYAAGECAAAIRARGEPATREERRAHDDRYLQATVEQTRTGRSA